MVSLASTLSTFPGKLRLCKMQLSKNFVLLADCRVRSAISFPQATAAGQQRRAPANTASRAIPLATSSTAMVGLDIPSSLLLQNLRWRDVRQNFMRQTRLHVVRIAPQGLRCSARLASVSITAQRALFTGGDQSRRASIARLDGRRSIGKLRAYERDSKPNRRRPLPQDGHR